MWVVSHSHNCGREQPRGEKWPTQLVALGRHENIADIIMVEARPYSPEIKAR